MNTESLKTIVQEIVKQARELKDKHTTEKDAAVNYAAIFSQNDREYQGLLEPAGQIGKIIQDTPTGPLFEIGGIDTVAGQLRLLKIRKPETTRPERGNADFTVVVYPIFKKTYLPKVGFKLIERKEYEMIELIDPSFNVRAYFSHPPLDQQLGLKQGLPNS
ncbi:MAG: hypothetical protein WC621_00725 [Patescibacteria group bacterium]